jgi:GTP-binding protein EngB required for normal cell division
VDAARWLATRAPLHIVATKIDKLSRSERTTHLRAIEQTFGQAPIAVSAAKGDGLDELWQRIARTARG